MVNQIRSEIELIKGTIDLYGCYIGILEADDYLPSYAFTIGLYEKYAHPEIVCFGLTTDTLTALLNYAALCIEGGQVFNTEDCYSDFLADHQVEFGDVAKEYYEPYSGTAVRYYGSTDFPMLQLIWPDMNGNFPEDIDFDEGLKFRQPLLDRNVDFMFYEERNLGVFVSKNVWVGKPILHVYHDHDGDWQFHSQAIANVDDAKLVAMDEVAKLDPAINQLFDLPPGWQASRKDINSEWQYEEFEEDNE